MLDPYKDHLLDRAKDQELDLTLGLELDPTQGPPMDQLLDHTSESTLAFQLGAMLG